ncbi:N-acyl homoserine lactone synthase [Solimonas sp. K1W22B-7]|uniref:NAD(P)/FAD-dependent oxidoreductase n=1 Tax=Solimonas sp. K1W22B-7 TaxID=2303331 RepID=UPI000E33501F|nr:FAD-dependent oxidoreductase [Solimonas sp. K1W22B-7]AXQ30248.1 N-acyl homoserine lactone synthase [Solimonas sp. K1W22B-7]
MKRIVIVGGGYAGMGLAKALDRRFEVRMIEPRDRFVHNLAAIRALAEGPPLLRQLAVPYDRLLRRGTVLQARAAAVTEQGVTLADGRQLEADYVVVATGSRHNGPFKPQTENAADFLSAGAALHQRLLQARSVAIVGGGPVGVELAGEIAAAHPGKALHLVSATQQLCAGFNPRLGERLAAQLRARGIGLKLGVTAAGLSEGPAVLALSDGTLLEADLVFASTGAVPDAALLRALPGLPFDTRGRAQLDPWLRPQGMQRLFVAGDVGATGDPMTAIAVTRQVPWLAGLLKSLAGGASIERLRPYRPWPVQPLVVPLGPSAGSSVLPLGREGMVFGDRVTSLLKGRDLLLPRYRRQLGYPARDPVAAAAVPLPLENRS